MTDTKQEPDTMDNDTSFSTDAMMAALTLAPEQQAGESHLVNFT